MTSKYENVYINETGTVTGPYEAKGPLKKYFDYSYEDLYFNEKTWEQAEIKMIKDSIFIALSKISLTKDDIDCVISSDLLNQITPSSYSAADMPYSFIGVYAACASGVLGLFIGANMIESNRADRIVCTVSSHNNGCEKQYRYPVEYGGPKPKTTTFTTTGCASSIISRKKSKIKIESITLGKVIDSSINDVFNMGGVMAIAAFDTLKNHLNDLKRDINYYDLVLTGDLGRYGKKIFKDLALKEGNIEFNNYEDTGLMLFDEKQPVYAGASGPACSMLVCYGYIFDLMKKKKLKKVLLIATGSLHSPTMVNQKLNIPSIAHAISLEAL